MKKYYLLFLIVACILSAIAANAQSDETEQIRVDYQGQVITDSDLDALTDQAEIGTYLTDHLNADTDGDGILDGAEVLQGTDPLDGNDPGFTLVSGSTETPWAWYVGRSAGLVGYFFLWLAIFLGLAVRNPLLKTFIAPIYSSGLHCFLAALAVFWGLVHGTSFLWDKTIGFGIRDIAVPFFSQTTLVNPVYLGLGIIAFYAMAAMTVTSYLHSHLKNFIWRILHFLHPLAFIFVVLHGYQIGTDMKVLWIKGTFIFSALLLVLLYLSSLAALIWMKIFHRTKQPLLNADRHDA